MSALPTEQRGIFRYLPLETVAYGRGALDRLPDEVERLGGRRVLVLTTRSLAADGRLLKRVETLLGERLAGTFAGIRQHTPSGDIWAAVTEARRVGADLLVSFGGSSVSDGAKLVAYALAGAIENIDDLRRLGLQHRELPGNATVFPHVAISTTLSAGELTTGASITDERSGVKGTLSHLQLTPKVVLLDPEATLATPEWLWLSSGLKALDHAVERVYLPQHHPLIDAACLEAIKLLVGNLAASRATDDAGLVARGQCQVGAWYSVFGWPNVRVGLSHIIGHQLGGRFGVPHGYTSCITMPAVIRFAGRWAGDRFAAIARALELGGADTEAAEAVAGTIERLVAELRLPARLRDVGVPEDGLGGLVDAAAHELAATEHRGGHVAPGATRDDVDRLVHAIW